MIYYFVDFGLSRQYNPEDGPPLELPPWGDDNSVPEFLVGDKPPFSIDGRETTHRERFKHELK